MKYGSVIIEGSSSATGIFDESRQGGFAGRIATRYETYNESLSQELNRELRWVFFSGHGQANTTAKAIAKNLPQHIETALSHTPHPINKVIGIFVLSAEPELIAQKRTPKAALMDWADGLAELGNVIRSHPIESIILAGPELPASSRLNNGTLVDVPLRQKCAVLTQSLAFDAAAPFITFEEALGAPLSQYLAPDNRHTNAQGYSRIANFLLPHLDTLLGITPIEPAEVSLDHYVPTFDCIDEPLLATVRAMYSP